MVKKICPDCDKELIQLKHSIICGCGRRIVITDKN